MGYAQVIARPVGYKIGGKCQGTPFFYGLSGAFQFRNWDYNSAGRTGTYNPDLSRD